MDTNRVAEGVSSLITTNGPFQVSRFPDSSWIERLGLHLRYLVYTMQKYRRLLLVTPTLQPLMSSLPCEKGSTRSSVAYSQAVCELLATGMAKIRARIPSGSKYIDIFALWVEGVPR